MTGLMAGKRGLIMGLANDKSLAWGIAKRLHAEGAELAFSYQGEVMEKRVRPLAEQLGCDFLIDCDVADMNNLDRAFDTLAAKWPNIDFVVHARRHRRELSSRCAFVAWFSPRTWRLRPIAGRGDAALGRGSRVDSAAARAARRTPSLWCVFQGRGNVYR